MALDTTTSPCALSSPSHRRALAPLRCVPARPPASRRLAPPQRAHGSAGGRDGAPSGARARRRSTRCSKPQAARSAARGVRGRVRSPIALPPYQNFGTRYTLWSSIRSISASPRGAGGCGCSPCRRSRADTTRGRASGAVGCAGSHIGKRRSRGRSSQPRAVCMPRGWFSARRGARGGSSRSVVTPCCARCCGASRCASARG